MECFVKSILVLISLILISLPSWGLDTATFEADHCTDMVWSGRSTGYFKIQDPLFFQNSEGVHSVQRVIFENEPILLWRSPNSVVKLRVNAQKPRDFVIHNDRLWLLMGEKLMSFNERGRLQGEYRFQAGLRSKDYPHSLVVVDDKIYIAHGGIGLVSFDPENSTYSFESPLKTYQEKGRSLAISLFHDETSGALNILHTGNSEKAFNGFISFDMTSKTILQEFEYSRRKDGVIDRYGLIYGRGNQIYINNGGWIHQLKKLTDSRSKQRPRWLAIKENSGGRQSFARIRGDFLFNENSILGCGVIAPKNRGDKRVAKLFSRRL
jgi:hypothetical protein